MESWIFEAASEKNECGTPACICGHALAVFDNKKYEEIKTRGCFDDWEIGGAKLLELSMEESDKLFYPNGNRTPKVAARVLRYFAKTGKVNWRVKESDLCG